MNNYTIEQNAIASSTSSKSMLQLAAIVMEDLSNKVPAKRIIHDRLNSDTELFKMLSLFLYSNSWMTRQNTVTEKGNTWMEVVLDEKLSLLG